MRLHCQKLKHYVERKYLTKHRYPGRWQTLYRDQLNHGNRDLYVLCLSTSLSSRLIPHHLCRGRPGSNPEPKNFGMLSTWLSSEVAHQINCRLTSCRILPDPVICFEWRNFPPSNPMFSVWLSGSCSRRLPRPSSPSLILSI